MSQMYIGEEQVGISIPTVDKLCIKYLGKEKVGESIYTISKLCVIIPRKKMVDVLEAIIGKLGTTTLEKRKKGKRLTTHNR